MKRLEKNIRFACLAALAIGFAACSQDELSPAGTAEGNAVQIGSVSIGGEVETRVSENPDDGGKSSLWNFDGTEQIAVQVKDGVQGVYTLNEDKTVTTTQPTYWTGGGTQTINAWYPIECGKIDLSNQTAGHLAYALFTSATGTYPDAVALNFSHSLAKLRVRLTGNVDAIEKIEAKNFTSCSLNTTDGTVTGNGDGYIPLSQANYSTTDGPVTYWEANLAPGAVSSDVLRINGVATQYIQNVTQFEAGKIYTVTLNVMETYAVSFEGCTIDDWQPGDDFVGGTAPADYIVEDGTYYVYSEVGLKAWADHVQAGNWSTNLTLMNDIIMTSPASGSSNWTPIGYRSDGKYSDKYAGTIEGNGYTIDNMVVNTFSSNFAAMIVTLSGTVQNLTIGSGSYFHAKYWSASVTTNVNGGKVINCHSAATVNLTLTTPASWGDGSIGGVVANNRGDDGNSYVIGCSFSGLLTADAGSITESIFVGGVVGSSWTMGNGNQVQVVGCVNSGGMIFRNAGSTTTSRVGGVVGSNYRNGSDRTNVSGCVMAGKMTFDYVTKRTAEYSAFAGTIGEIYGGASATHVYCTSGSIESSWRNPYRTSNVTYDTLLEVDGTAIDWPTATANVNTAIEEWNAANGNICPNHFEQQNGEDQPPTLIKK